MPKFGSRSFRALPNLMDFRRVSKVGHYETPSLLARRLEFLPGLGLLNRHAVCGNGKVLAEFFHLAVNCFQQ